MIEKFDVSGVHMTVGDDLNKYVLKKIGGLEKYIPSHARASVHVSVKLKEGRAKNKDDRTCEVLVSLPKETIAISETTVNMFAAVDIVEEKLKNQLRKYKQTHGGQKLHSRLLAKLKRSV